MGSEGDRREVMFRAANHAHFVEYFASLSVLKKPLDLPKLC